MDRSIEFGSSCLAGFFLEGQVTFLRSVAFPEKKFLFFFFFSIASYVCACVCVCVLKGKWLVS